jgi:NAD(P)-dependent dehydrogenase (short-subunit alcohol dehydrogenase family)
VLAKASLEASTRYLAYSLGTRKIRVNCISAGPMKTLAARGIAGFGDMLKHYEAHAPLKRNVLPDELGATGAFLASDWRGRDYRSGPCTWTRDIRSWGCDGASASAPAEVKTVEELKR